MAEAPAAADTHVMHRTPRSTLPNSFGLGGLAALVDGLVLAASYLLAYRLRFGDQFGEFRDAALSSLPPVVIAAVASLAAAGVYRRREAGGLAVRLIVGTVAGMSAAAALLWFTRGFEGLNRLAFPVAGGFFLLLATTWRSAVALVRLVGQSRRLAATDLSMQDRADSSAAAARTLIDAFRYGELLKNLVMKDLKLKYRGSVFGFLWSLVNPLLMIIVYSAAFTYILRIRMEGFVFFLLLGILAWTFFANSAAMSTGAIVDSGGLVKSVVFPRAILPVATVLFNFAQYLLTIVVFLPLMLVAYRVVPAAPMLLFPVFLALQVLFTMGVALVLAAGTAHFRDLRHLLEVALSVMFWTTPILYQIGDLPDLIRTAVLLSPMSSFVLAYQQMFYYHQWPDLSVWLMAVTYAVVAPVSGLLLFIQSEDRFAEQV